MEPGALWSRTPLVPSEPLSRAAGTRVWLKLESVQPAGSFKQRGMGMACQRAVARGARRLVTSSGGNAGYAVAWAGRRLGVPVTVVVPSRSSGPMRAAIGSEGAEVVVWGDVWDVAHEHAMELARDEAVALIHPFDHPDVWAGNATLVDELAEELEAPPAHLVASIGGGGLMCGVVDGARAHGWSTRLWGTETEGAASFAAAVAAGVPTRLPRIDSIALTLGALQVCEGMRERAHHVRSEVVTDRQAVEALLRFADDHRMLVEPACGAALAPVYAGRITGPGDVVVVVCGGASASLGAVAAWREAVGL